MCMPKCLARASQSLALAFVNHSIAERRAEQSELEPSQLRRATSGPSLHSKSCSYRGQSSVILAQVAEPTFKLELAAAVQLPDTGSLQLPPQHPHNQSSLEHDWAQAYAVPALRRLLPLLSLQTRWTLLAAGCTAQRPFIGPVPASLSSLTRQMSDEACLRCPECQPVSGLRQDLEHRPQCVEVYSPKSTV